MTDRRASFTAAFVLASLVILLVGCGSMPQPANTARMPMVQDWSTSHWIYPGGGSVLDPAQISDPRMLHSWLASHPAWTRARTEAFQRAEMIANPQWNVLMRSRNASRIDWAMSLGPSGGMPVGEIPAKFNFDIHSTPDCTNDFAVYVINATPSAGSQANIVAFNNLYSGSGVPFCGMANPTFMWSYAAGTGAITTSPVLSLDGTKVAFVDNELTGPPFAPLNAHFNVLTWAAGQGTDATTGSVAPGGGSTLTSLTFTDIPGNANCPVEQTTDTNASPFIDYENDIAYLATDNGVLYRINGVFNSTPTVAYCTIVNINKAMTSPVFDSVSGNVFVSDGQLLYAFTPGANSFTQVGPPVALGSPVAHSINQSPMVDAANGWVYTFAGTETTGTNAAVAQVKADLSSSTIATMGDATTSNYILDGQFDNHYYTTGPTGAHATMYACGTQIGSGGADPSLYAFSFTGAGVLNPTAIMSDNRSITTGATAGSCAPLLEIFDGTFDLLFVGVSGADQVTSWGIGTPLANGAVPTHTQAGQTGGTSGFSVDNISGDPQASSIYFGTLAPGTTQCGTGNYCAVKLTQTGLQ